MLIPKDMTALHAKAVVASTSQRDSPGAQEYCNGGSLRASLVSGSFAEHSAHRLRHHWRTVMHAAKGIAAGMQYVHGKRICHGDLNPSNILIKVRRFCFCVCVGCWQVLVALLRTMT